MATLNRSLGFWSLLFTGVSGIIGSGWLFAPFYTAQIAGPLSLISWCIGGVIILAIALSFAEVTTLFPVAGGLVQTVQLSFGEGQGLIISWISWLSFVMVPAIEAQAALQYSHYFFPHLVVAGTGGTQLTPLGYLCAFLLLLVFFVLNNFGIRLVAKLNNLLAIWKLAIPLLTILALYFTAFHSQNFHVQSQPISAHLHTVLSGVSLGGVVFSLVGFRTIVELGGEAKNPQRTLPLALIFTLLVCTFIYLLLQTAFIGALSPQDIAHGWAHLDLQHDSSPLLSLAATLGMVWLVGLLYLDAVASPSGTGLITSASTARIVFAMARQGYLPKKLALLNKHQAPILALLLNLLLACAFFLPFHGWQAMASFLASIAVVGYSFGPLCLHALRKQQPHRARTFRLPWAPLLSFLAFFFSNLVIYWTGWQNLLKLIVLMVILLVLALIVAAYKGQLKTTLKQLSWLGVYLIGLFVMAKFGSFGQHAALSFDWDFVAILVFSMIVYALAIALRLPSDETEKRIKLVLSEI